MIIPASLLYVILQWIWPCLVSGLLLPNFCFALFILFLWHYSCHSRYSPHSFQDHLHKTDGSFPVFYTRMTTFMKEIFTINVPSWFSDCFNILYSFFFLKHSRQSQEKHPAFSSMNLDNKLSTTVYQYNILWIETSYPSKVSWGNKFSYNKQFLMISIMKYIREDHSTILYPHPFSPSINILMYCVICYK